MSKVVLISLLYLSACFRAECANPLAALAQNYTQMQDVNIVCEASISYELTPYFIHTFPNKGGEPKWQQHIFFCADKKGFDLEESRHGSKGRPVSFSYDGTTYQTYLGWLDTLIVSKKNAKPPPIAWNSNPLVLLPAMFASNRKGNQIDCLWRDVIDPGFWATAPSSLSPLVNGNRITMITSAGSPLGISGWEIHQGDTEKLWNKYTCTEIGAVPFKDNGRQKTFFYSRKAVLELFEDTGDLDRIDTIEITRVTVNDPRFDESKFIFDRSRVKQIIDVDAHPPLQ